LSECPTRSGCSTAAASKGNQGRSLKTAGAIVGGVGIGGVAAGLIWLMVEKPTSASSSGGLAGRALSRPVVQPVLAPGYAGVEVGSAL
jgi:hypothetical protein